MPRKITIAVITAILVGAIALFAAEKVKEKSPADKPKDEAKAIGQMEQKEGLLDQLIAAYKANDREKMGQIIKKMEHRRDKMRKLAKLNRWHQWAHRQWAMTGPPRDWQAGQGGWGMAGHRWQGGWGMAGPRWQGGWGHHRPWGGPAERRGLAEGGQHWGQCPCWRGWDRDGYGPARRSESEVGPRAWQDNRPMRGGDGFGPGWGGPQRPHWPGLACGESRGGRNAEPQRWNAPPGDEPRTDVPPADWGW